MQSLNHFISPDICYKLYFDFKYPGLLYPPLQFSSHCTPEIDNSDVVVGSAESAENPKGLS